ncbi:hypothetical protein NPIL_464381, partial [Nephila pilipes]
MGRLLKAWNGDSLSPTAGDNLAESTRTPSGTLSVNGRVTTSMPEVDQRP